MREIEVVVEALTPGEALRFAADLDDAVKGLLTEATELDDAASKIRDRALRLTELASEWRRVAAERL